MTLTLRLVFIAVADSMSLDSLRTCLGGVEGEKGYQERNTGTNASASKTSN